MNGLIKADPSNGRRTIHVASLWSEPHPNDQTRYSTGERPQTNISPVVARRYSAT